MSDFTGMKTAEQTKGGNYVLPGRHVFEIRKHINKISQNKRKVVGKKFFIVELQTVESAVHDVGGTRSWLVDFSKPGALGNIKHYLMVLLPQLKPEYTKELLEAADDIWWETTYNWLCSEQNPVYGRGIKLAAEAYQKPTDSGGVFTMVNWDRVGAAVTKAA